MTCPAEATCQGRAVNAGSKVSNTCPFTPRRELFARSHAEINTSWSFCLNWHPHSSHDLLLEQCQEQALLCGGDEPKLYSEREFQDLERVSCDVRAGAPHRCSHQSWHSQVLLLRSPRHTVPSCSVPECSHRRPQSSHDYHLTHCRCP